MKGRNIPRDQLSVPYMSTASKSSLSASGVQVCVRLVMAWRIQSTGVRPVWTQPGKRMSRTHPELLSDLDPVDLAFACVADELFDLGYLRLRPLSIIELRMALA